MFKTTLQSKLVIVSSAAVMTMAMGFSSIASAGSVIFADPVPYNAAIPTCNGGISYEWTVNLGKKDSASFVNHVGAKSFNEPPPAYGPPDAGWTHTSNWVALNLSKKSNVRIEVARQEGVTIAGLTNGKLTIQTARNMLVPAIAVYSGWENSSCEDHRYNTSGNFDWSTIQFIGNAANENGKTVAVYESMLPAGHYSIAIGGSPRVLPSYPDSSCDVLDPTCYTYTGRHGYRATIKTGQSH